MCIFGYVTCYTTHQQFVSFIRFLSDCFCLTVCMCVWQERKDRCWAELITIYCLSIHCESLTQSLQRKEEGRARERRNKNLVRSFPFVVLHFLLFQLFLFLPLYNWAVGGWDSSHCCVVCYLFFYSIASQCAFGVASPGWLKWTRVCQ